MDGTSGRAPRGGLGRLLVGAVVFATVAPPALIAVPLAALLVLPGPRTSRHLVGGGIAAGLALWWLLLPGAPPDQVVRAGTVLSAVAFAALSHRTAASFVHRALAAIAIATGGVALLMAIGGPSWAEVHWWTMHRAGLVGRLLLGVFWGPPGMSPGDFPIWWPDPEPLEAWMDWYTAFVAGTFPGLTALQLLGGMAVATAVYHRVAERPRGVPLRPLRTFRFSEHLGWGAALPLVVIVLVKVAAARLAAANLLLVAAVLYGLRGVAVAAFGMQMLGAGGFLLWAVLALVIVLMLPVVAGGAILVGVLDAGLDLRRRWATPPTVE